MKIIKFGLPLIAVVAAMAYKADQGLRRQDALTADAGALPETTVFANKLYGPVMASNNAMKPAIKASPRIAQASVLGG